MKCIYVTRGWILRSWWSTEFCSVAITKLKSLLIQCNISTYTWVIGARFGLFMSPLGWILKAFFNALWVSYQSVYTVAFSSKPPLPKYSLEVPLAHVTLCIYVYNKSQTDMPDGLLHRTIWNNTARNCLEKGRRFQKILGRWLDEPSVYRHLSRADFSQVKCSLSSCQVCECLRLQGKYKLLIDGPKEYNTKMQSIF